MPDPDDDRPRPDTSSDAVDISATDDMAVDRSVRAGTIGRWHDILLDLAGRLPDDSLAEAREFLSASRVDQVAAALAYPAALLGIPVSADEYAAIVPLLPTDVRDRLAADLLVAHEDLLERPVWVFTPHRPASRGEPSWTSVRAVDLTSLAGAGYAAGHASGHGSEDGIEADLVPDHVDQALTSAAAAEPALIGLWRTWRWPSEEPLTPVRVVLATVRPDTGAEEVAALAVRLQRLALRALDETEPWHDWPVPVEVTVSGTPGCPYQRAARDGAALLWARTPPHPVLAARVVDGTDADGSGFILPDHPRLEDADRRAELVEHLMTAPVVVESPPTTDPLAPDAGEVMPLTVRTDGTWAWSDAVAYLLEVHHLAPEPRLLAHLDATAGRPVPPLDEVTRHRVLAALQTPDDRMPDDRTS
jgi:hypothetical protein